MDTMAALKTSSIQRDLFGNIRLESPLKKIRPNGKDAYPQGSGRHELEVRFENIIYEDLTLGAQVSYVGNRPVPFLRIYRYKEAFSLNFVNYFLTKFNVKPGDYVFDPFSGMGTTLFTSMLNGIPSVGVDKLPIAHFVSKTLPLFLTLKASELSRAWGYLVPKIASHQPADIASDVSIMKVAFDDSTLLTLRKIKANIADLPDDLRDMLLLVFFSVQEDCSFTSKDGQFLRLEREKKTAVPMKVMGIKVAQVEEDIRRLKLLYPHLNISEEILPDVRLGDTRDLSDIPFRKPPTVLITSPPYANRYDYTRSYSLELCFHFVKDFEELKALRFGILRSHIESKIGKDEKSPHPIITEVLEALSKKELNNPKIPSMLTAYFIDMQKVIKEWHRVLAPNAKVAMVVDNVRFEGELIPVDLVLSDMAETTGFKVKEVIVARYKGNSSQQMKKYGKVPVRESIVVWEK